MTSYAIYLGPEVQKDTLGLDQICTRALAAWDRILVSRAHLELNRYLVGEVSNDVLQQTSIVCHFNVVLCFLVTSYRYHVFIGISGFLTGEFWDRIRRRTGRTAASLVGRGWDRYAGGVQAMPGAWRVAPWRAVGMGGG